MDAIKVEGEDLPLNVEDLNCDTFCFICLQQVCEINEEQFNSLNFFFNFLKISEIKEAFVCEKCGEKLAKFVKLCKDLEKIRLEMDYLLGFIQSEISNSNGDFERDLVGVNLVRECVVRRCREKIYNPQPKILLERVDAPKSLKRRSLTAPSDCSDDWIPDWDADRDRPSSSSDSDEPYESNEGYPVPAIGQSKSLKLENKLEDKATISNRKTTRVKCLKTFSREGYLKIHNTIVHLRLKPFKCSKCHKSFSFRNHLRRHVDAIHVHPKSYRSKPRSLCPKCPRTFSCEKRLTHHLNTVHSRLFPKTFKCTKCSKTFKAKRNLKIHNDAVHLHLRPFKCSTCSKSFSTGTNLRLHTNVVHLRLKPYKCDICDKSFASQFSFRIHKATPHKPKSEAPKSKLISCKICSKSYDKFTLNMHIRAVHGERKIPCDICKKTFKTQYQLKGHVFSVHEKRRHHCQAPGCDKSYCHKNALVVHYKLTHPDFFTRQKTPKNADSSEKLENSNSILECNLCGKKLKCVASLRSHMKNIHAPKTLLCPDCDFKAGSTASLTKHIERYHKIVMVQCEFCSKQMKSVDLDSHISILHGEKKFICQYCGYAATRENILQMHIKRRHNNKSKSQDIKVEQRLHCQVSGCGKSFTRPRLLVAHYKLKHPDLPVLRPERRKRPSLAVPKPSPDSLCCKKCGKSFTKIQYLRKHRCAYAHGQNVFPCDICGKILTSLEGLKLHISAIHEKVRHHCQVEGCNKDYSSTKRLYGHYKAEHPEFNIPPPKPKTSKYADKFTLVMENGESVVECKLCKRKFKTTQSCAVHISVVHGPKRFKCQDCDYETYQKSILQKHVKRKHEDEHKLEVEDGKSRKNTDI